MTATIRIMECTPTSPICQLVYLDDAQACILDNNFIGDNDLVWMSTKEFLTVWAGDGGMGRGFVSTRLRRYPKINEKIENRG